MNKFRLIIDAQFLENYGAHDWDGEGECPQRWKSKGNAEMIVGLFDLEDIVKMGAEGLERFGSAAIARHLKSDDYTAHTDRTWELVPPGELTPTEAWWMEVAGEIKCPTPYGFAA
jgi:hypothetical protein